MRTLEVRDQVLCRDDLSLPGGLLSAQGGVAVGSAGGSSGGGDCSVLLLVMCGG